MEDQLSFIAVFQLLVFFQIKHFLCDFPLQGGGFFQKKSASGLEFILPLSLHCFVHSMGTFLIVAWFNFSMWPLIFFDFCVHFIMDRIKSSPRCLGRFRDTKKQGFWNSLGLDQMVHHLTHYFIIWVLVSS